MKKIRNLFSGMLIALIFVNTAFAHDEVNNEVEYDICWKSIYITMPQDFQFRKKNDDTVVFFIPELPTIYLGITKSKYHLERQELTTFFKEQGFEILSEEETLLSGEKAIKLLCSSSKVEGTITFFHAYYIDNLDFLITYKGGKNIEERFQLLINNMKLPSPEIKTSDKAGASHNQSPTP